MTIGIPYAKPGMLSSDLEELLAELVGEMHDEGYGPEFEANWARTILSSLKIPDAYYVTCPECDKRIEGKGRTEDEVTKCATVKYARHYAWQHTKERLGANLSNLEVAASSAEGSD
jgi:hypothetical protein